MDFKEIFNNKPRCQHLSEDGKRCKADPQTNNKFCFMHDPEQKEKQSEARKKGGQMRFQPYEPKMPASFQYNPLNDRAQINDFLDQLGLYLQRGEMDQRTVRSYLFLISLKLSVCKDEAREQREAKREAQRSAERQAQRDGKEPKFFDTALDGGTLYGTRQELVEYWKKKALENANANALVSAAAQNQDQEPGPQQLSKTRTKTRTKPGAMPSEVALSFRELDELEREEERKEQERAAARQKLSQWSQREDQESAPPKPQPQPVPPAPASRGSAPAPRPATYNLSEAEMERLRDDIWIESARKPKRSRRKSRQTWR